MKRDWLKIFQYLALFVVAVLIVEYAIWTALWPKPLLFAIAGSAIFLLTTYFGLIRLVIKDPTEGMVKTGFTFLLKLFLSTWLRTILTLIVLIGGAVFAGVSTYRYWAAEQQVEIKNQTKPNYVIQTFHGTPNNPVAGVIVMVNDPIASARFEQTTNALGQALFRLETSTLGQISVEVTEGDVRKTAIFPVERVDPLPNTKAIDLDAITTWVDTSAKATVQVAFASARSEDVAEYMKSFTGENQTTGDQQFLTVNEPFGQLAAKQISVRPQFTVGFDPVRKIPRWVAYRMNPGDAALRRVAVNLTPDPLLPADVQASKDAYADKSYDPVSLVPLVDVLGNRIVADRTNASGFQQPPPKKTGKGDIRRFPNTKFPVNKLPPIVVQTPGNENKGAPVNENQGAPVNENVPDTPPTQRVPRALPTFLSLVVPQNRQLNEGVWSKLEEYSRVVAGSEPLWVIAGPAFVPDAKDGRITYAVIGDGVAVPTHFFRILIRRTETGVEAIAFLVPNSADANESIDKYLVPLSKLQAITGLELFSGLRPADRDKLFSSRPQIWDAKPRPTSTPIPQQPIFVK